MNTNDRMESQEDYSISFSVPLLDLLLASEHGQALIQEMIEDGF